MLENGVVRIKPKFLAKLLAIEIMLDPLLAFDFNMMNFVFMCVLGEAN